MRIFKDLPLSLYLYWAVVALMLIPMTFATIAEDWLFARTFFYHALVLGIWGWLLSIAIADRFKGNKFVHYLADVLVGFALLPVLMALPVDYLLPHINFWHAYFEMSSAFTTTGATLLGEGQTIPDVIHLWRGLIAWLGGLFMIIIASTLFFSINLGGFEVYSQGNKGLLIASVFQRGDLRHQMRRFARVIAPIYIGLTLVLALALIIAGDRPFVAFIHATSVLSTSGISPIGGLENAASGWVGEAMIFAFLLFALSRHHLFLFDSKTRLSNKFAEVKSDREFALAWLIIFGATAVLFLRHFWAAFKLDEAGDISQALTAVWGTVFNVLSFLTTTGFQSQYWRAAQDWSGLGTTVLILMILTMMGGGIATTAGGIKLLRVYALIKHGQREMYRLNFPHSVGGAGMQARALRREGAYAAWIFFMLFLAFLAVGMMAFGLTGLDFENSLILAVSGLSNTGPLIGTVYSDFIGYMQSSAAARWIFCVLMVLGRLEILAVMAVLNPMVWRR